MDTPIPVNPPQPNQQPDQKKGILNTNLDTIFAQSSIDPVTFIRIIIEESISLKASDIFFEPVGATFMVRIRVDGVLYKLGDIDIAAYDYVLARIKVLSRLDLAGSLRVQEGQFITEHEGRMVNLRIEIARTVQGELVVIRIHEKKSIIMSLTSLGFTDEAYRSYKEMINQQNGLLLVCGPTGCGKTTTLYSTISQFNEEGKYNILTIEDPVEYKMSGINQMQTDVKSNFTFSVGLRTILRLSPDVVLVGEIRDRETAEIAVESGLTGQLVLSTTHAKNCVGTVFRLLDLGIEPYFLNSALVGVLAQRLVRKVCNQCKNPYTPSPEESTLFQNVLGRTPTQLIKGTGCPACEGMGYKGRIGIFEILKVDTKVRILIRNRVSEDKFQEELDKQGFITLLRDGLIKCEAGLTTVDEIMRRGIMK